MRILMVFEDQYGGLVNPDLGDAAWLVDSPVNRSLATRVWTGADAGSQVTLFDATMGEPGDADAIARFEDIDLHHPSWTEIDVVGVRLTPALEQEFRTLGIRIAACEAGFVARR
ncbi:hypothetical protein [Phenylobacterium sp. 58.2.17]|jgi:hypothetical protein|uniref:hypothetical protein n=1 Tax=Phenylobacterium sp. 58.2.17 TaxID=2969306 RepID=UPI002264511B|nr:hypothetical protein [Phenylobacterium sp. 58.2.17]MCX7587569.1 hypothetical protein [Phenylobacterium sp. 58.2.17]